MFAMLAGSLSFPAGALEKWRALPLSSKGMKWPKDEAPIFNGEGDLEHKTVGELLDAAAKVEGVDGAMLALSEPALTIGFLDPPALEVWGHPLAVAFRLAQEAGAAGVVSFFVPPFGAAFSIVLGKKKATAEWGPIEEAVPAVAEQVVLVDGWVSARGAEPGLLRDAFLEREKRYDLGPLTSSAAQQEVLARLRSQAPEVLWKAMKKDENLLGPRDRLFSKQYSSQEALKAAVDAGEPFVRAAGVELLSLIDAAAAEALATKLLHEDASRYVRFSALGALSRVDSASAFAVILDARAGDPPIVLRDRPAALARSSFAGAVDVLLAGVDSALTLPAAKKQPSDEEAFAAFRACACATALGIRGEKKATKKLIKLFLETAVPVVRHAAGEALANIGGPEVEKIGGKIQCALMGMGLALNQDDKRRRKLLNNTKEEDSGGINKFDDLSLETFKTLVEENFISLDGRQNDAPSAGEFLDFMTQFPEVKAHGYSVSPKRDDYRVMIEGLSCDMSELEDEERKEAIRAAFTELCEEANDFRCDDDDLFAWWT